MTNKKGVAKKIDEYKANVNASRHLIHSMKMQEA